MPKYELPAEPDYDALSERDLLAEDAALAKVRTAIRLRQNEVTGRLDAQRAIRTANLDPNTIQYIARSAKIDSAGESKGAKV